MGSGILGFRPCWCPSPFPSPSISRGFPFTLLRLQLDFIRLFLRAGGSAPRHPPSSFTWAWDQHRATVDPEAEFALLVRHRWPIDSSWLSEFGEYPHPET